MVTVLIRLLIQEYRFSFFALLAYMCIYVYLHICVQVSKGPHVGSMHMYICMCKGLKLAWIYPSLSTLFIGVGFLN